MQFIKGFEQEVIDEEPVFDLKHVINTQFSIRPTNSPFSPVTQELDTFPPPRLDLSLDRTLHRQNAEVVERSSISYLNNCLQNGVDAQKGFNDESLYSFIGYPANEEELSIEGFIQNNRVLNQSDRKLLLQALRENEDLRSFLQELTELFSNAISHELIIIVHAILKEKLTIFKKMSEEKENLIPKFDCFWGEQGEEKVLRYNCPVFGDTTREEIAKFSQEGLTYLADRLYFSKQIRFLNLVEVKPSIKPGVEALSQFKVFLSVLARTLFMSMSGISEEDGEVEDFGIGMFGSRRWSRLSNSDADEESEGDNLIKRVKTL